MITLSFTGDLLAYHSLIRKSKKGGKYDFSDVFRYTHPLFSKSSYVIGNLETPIAGQELGYTRMDMLFNTPVEFALAAKNAGFNMMTTANNHCADRGMAGVDKTLNNLSKIGLDHTGITKSSAEKNYVIKCIGGERVAFISYTYGTNPNVNGFELTTEDKKRINVTREQDNAYRRGRLKQLLINVVYALPKSVQDIIHPLYPDHPYLDNVADNAITDPCNAIYIERMKDTIKMAKSESDFTVFCLHSGGQFNNELGPYTRYLLDVIKGCGVDAIICNHPHCVLGTEYSENCFTAYSLGNFTFTPEEGYFIDGVLGEYGIVLHLDIEKQLQSVRYSIVKNVRTKDGREQVIPVSELYNMISSEDKTSLLNDCRAVANRFTNGTSSIESIREFYTLYKNEHMFQPL